jgi:hypothetical protein
LCDPVLLALIRPDHALNSGRVLKICNAYGLAVNTFHVRVWGSDTSIIKRVDLIALGIDNASSGFVSSLEADFAFQSFDLLGIEEITVLIPVFNLFFPR